MQNPPSLHKISNQNNIFAPTRTTKGNQIFLQAHSKEKDLDAKSQTRTTKTNQNFFIGHTIFANQYNQAQPDFFTGGLLDR